MNKLAGWVVLTFAVIFVIGGCSEQESVEGASQASTAALAQSAEPGPAPQAAAPAQTEPAPQLAMAGPSPAPAAAPPTPAPEPKAEAPRPPEAKPITAEVPAPVATLAAAQPIQAAPQEPAPAPAKNAVAKDVIVLTGSPLGGVRLQHKLHATRAGNDCAKCHHPSKPQKPASAPQQACSDCHMAKAAAPMKTIYQGAFHNPVAQAGTCIDCHKAENAKGKKAPVGCMDCHKQENK